MGFLNRFLSKASSNKLPTESGPKEKKVYKLVVVRHGESEWNKLNLFTGWTDVNLTALGETEAAAGAAELKKEGLEFDVAYTSLLKRAISTLWIILKGLDLQWIPVVRDWKLNERHYGALQGLNKAETTAKHGEEQVYIWRRSYDIPPPSLELDDERHPSFDRRYAKVPKKSLPATECLKDTVKRVMETWNENIVPDILAGKRVLIAAHGNSLRALVKHLDNISEEDIPTLNIPTGVPLYYELDENLKPIPQQGAFAPLSGRYLGDQDAIASKISAVANQAKAAQK